VHLEALGSHAPNAAERRVFTVLSLAYAALVLSVLPVATLPGIVNPHVATISAGGVLFADLCTVLLLGSEYRRRGNASLLYITCAYFYSAVMAVLHILTFPGAILPQPLLGNAQTVSWLFAMWRAGTAMLFLVGILSAGVPAPEESPTLRLRRLARALGLTGLACAVVAAVFANVQFVSTVGNTFTGVSLWLNWATVGIYFLGAVLIWRRKAFNEAIYLWLALVLVASAADLALTTVSGARYTLGWYIGRASWVISACVLLLLWLTHDSITRTPARLRWIGAYGSALCILVATLLLHWFLLPWLGTTVPFIATFAAVAIAVWLGGWGPALIVASVGYVISNVYFMEPTGRFDISTIAHQISLLMYCLTSTAIVGLGEAMRRARDAYRASEQRFRLSQDASLQGYALLRAVRHANGSIDDFAFEYINPRGASMINLSATEVAGKSVLTTLPGVKAAGLFDMFARAVNERIPLDSEIVYGANGLSGCFRNMVVPVGDGVAVSFSDITDTRRLESELKQRAAELEQADINKRHFLAVLAHELRNPMAPLRNALNILTVNPDKHAVATVLPIMDRQLSHLTRLVDDLLDISRIDRGKLELKRERLNIETVVKNAIETAKPSVEAKSHELVVRFPSDAIYVHGDLVRLTQVIANLVNNAAKFTPSRGQIEITMKVEGEQAIVIVADSGIGIPAETLSHIFDMFVQLDSGKTVTSAGLGLGLGLTIARSIATSHGGTLEAFSPGLGKGSQLVLRLPLAPAPLGERRLRAVPELSAGRNRILVVDDNEDAANTLADLLRLVGHDVRVAFDGAQALSQALEFAPAIVFIDLNMPGIDGIQLAQRMRENPRMQEIKLVALTGMGQQEDVERTLEAGFHAHLTKPASFEQIMQLATG
jgi:two-component system CheB/CheR fusion protein